jgi:uncharacterized protein
MHIVSHVIDVVLAAYIIWQVARFLPEYRRLKAAIAAGDTQARSRVYREAIVFEWISALLAIIALRFDWSKLSPLSLNLEGSSLTQLIAHAHEFDRGLIGGIVIGIAAGTVAFMIARLRARKSGGATVPNPRTAWIQKLIPDFSALIPTTAHERMIWAVVAINAGICEEVVFRGWLLSTLHGIVGVSGLALVAVAAILFGSAHIYQGPTGVFLTTLAGALFCLLYVATGSLLIPIALHVLVDIRFAILPGLAPARPSEATA